MAAIAWLRAFLPADAAVDRAGLSAPLVAAAFLPAGALAGQVFRSAMTLLAPFFGLDEEEEEEEEEED